MASLRISIEEKLGTLPYFFIYAILEWVVIILLFIDGILAFLSNEIARVFDLRIPCLLCTRLDHILVQRDSNFYYNDSICEVHKKDISTLAYCHVHRKLSDIRSMCRGCLLSFSSDNDSDCDKYKSIVGILQKDVDYFAEDERRLLLKPLKKDDVGGDDQKIGVFRCCCCGDSLKSISTSKFNRSLSMNAPAPSPRAPWFPGRMKEGGNMDLAPHGRYTELKLSDNEWEVHEEENASHAENHARTAREEVVKPTTVPLLPETEDMNDDAARTPICSRGNKFFGIPLSDAAPVSPRWANRASRKLPSDKLDLLLEPIDLGNEADDDIVTRLKRQVNLERRSLMALYLELDEERSASAVAANNAMAMITRLQADKAAVQMEALQYQRMMEEQAEYDQEALQMMKDVLFKREEEMKVLESEVEMYREKYGEIKRIGSEIWEVDVDDDYQDMHSQAFSSFSEKSDPSGADQNEDERAVECVGGDGDELCMDFEGEKCYLLGLLRDLEKKINGASDGEPDFSEGKRAGSEGNRGVLTREVSLIRERLRAVEAESGFLKHAAMALQRGEEGTKLLSEIAQHLRRLRQ